MLGKRVLTAAVLIPIVIGAIHYLPAKGFILFLSLISILAAYEFSTMFFRGSLLMTFLFPLIASVSVYYVSSTGCEGSFTLFMSAFLIFSFLSLFSFANPGQSLQRLSMGVLGFIYISLFLPFFYFLRGVPRGEHLIYFIAMTVFVGDTAAYAFGRKMGKIKLAPSISPNKTLEGAIAGAFFGTLSGYLYLRYVYALELMLPYYLLAFFVSTVGQAGDLLESSMKRAAGVKDSGAIFPGHGGMLDRLDSLLLNAFVVFMAVKGA